MFGLLPNELWDYGPIDAVHGLGTALVGRHVVSQSAIDIPGVGSAYGTRSARAAIVLALKALQLPHGSTVGVPLYCCPVVFKAIQAAGLRPKFLDVDLDTCCLAANDLDLKHKGISAVVTAHMFGNVRRIAELRDAAPHVPLIEDCAQGLGARIGGHAAGSFGEMSAFSFRSGKYLSVGEGGAILSNNGRYDVALASAVRDMAVPTRTSEFVHVATTLIRSQLRSRPWWGSIGTKVWKAYNRQVSYESQSPLALEQMYETDRAMIQRRLPRLGQYIEKQRANAKYYLESLQVEAGMLCSEPEGMFYNRLQFPLLIPTAEQCDRLTAWLLKDGISTSRPYRAIASIARDYYGYSGDCPNSERIASTVLVIPCHHALRSSDVDRIADSVNRGWADIGGRGRTMSAPKPRKSIAQPVEPIVERRT